MQVQDETSINKLIILFVFDKMETALSERTVIETCTSGNTWLNYMDCMDLLPRLVDDGFLCRISASEEEGLYTLTSDGRETLSNFYIMIPKSIRDEITTFIKNNSGKLRNRQECKSDYYQNVDGTYTVFLKIYQVFSSKSSDSFLPMFQKSEFHYLKKLFPFAIIPFFFIIL